MSTRGIGGWLGAVACLVLAAVACAGHAGGPSVEDASGILTRYVEALDAGNVDGAMAQRCTAARIGDQDKTAFTSEAARLFGVIGPVKVASVHKKDPPTGMRPVADLPNPVQFSFRLAIKGVPAGEDLVTIVVEEDGQPRLCGIATQQADRLHSSLPAQVADLGITAKDPQALMPAAPGLGYSQDGDAALDPATPGVRSSWSRSWRTGDYGGARVTASAFESPAQASARAGQLAAAKASDGVERFYVPGLPQAVGVRYLADAWLWIQPPTTGPFIDQVVMRFGTTEANLSVSNLAPGSGHDVVAKMAAEVASLARS